MSLSELGKRVEQTTGKKLTLDDLLKRQDPKTLKKVLRRP